ncbi:putative mucin [Aspergillus saccharolyticus JOP 1030-1]|uniref:Mucin n=1 Tax=Aspergillus saccharolyticus JOP 1030-1 TaxID=1450539 RepID=A0A318ZID2_9EURO|nr:hypothetical protein BP01DRAFT_80280 [Aspergillus saccharolyticus JOP 1030-1]PYH44333.1 hypothetical protein BP01DRAFT_80280 [Aspergillus saccharolyticus JOP 1030-1]
MSLPVLPPQPHLPTLHPVTPTIAHYSRTDSARKRSYEPVTHNSDHWTVPFRDGLPTPPSDMNGIATYNVIPSSAYGSKLDGVTLPPYAKVSDYSRRDYDGATTMIPASKPYYQPPAKENSTREQDSQKKSSTNSAASYLQIPSTINNSKGSLAEFAAQMTCLFWFESAAQLKAVEDRSPSAGPLAPETMPTMGFQKWVTNILSTTQVSQNVVLLALMFVYRLKKFNPGVRGKKGSEYRLMTIALMLGNKFLDDNTYTNKTWAEVSGITVQEIHIMEVEFLSNIRYNLFVSKEEWGDWHVKLGLFADYFNKAPRVVEKSDRPAAPTALRVSPNLGPIPRAALCSPSKLPSPPATDSLRSYIWPLPLNAVSYAGGVCQLPPSDMPLASSHQNPRKRSRDEAVEELPSKRNTAAMVPNLPSSSALTNIPALPLVMTSTAASASTSVPAHIPPMPMPDAVSRLPRPNFPSLTMAPAMPPAVSSVPQLPSTSRVMPPVYPPPNTWISQQMPTTTTVAPTVPPLNSGLYASLPDPSRHHNSPFAISSATISPAVSAYSVTPQTHLSPSFFLANRNSPYRPVRSVNTLLIPPPSTSLQQQRSVPFDHMHYQPLGKTAAERKTGVLPYLHHEAWPTGPIAQPMFHTSFNFS